MRTVAARADPCRVEASIIRLCADCGDRIGIYEPIVAAGPCGVRRTSLAREPELADDDDTLLAHVDCSEWPSDSREAVDHY